MKENNLKIKLFGNVTLTLNGTDITAKLSSKSIAIICILMLQKDMRISRQELINYLWPNSSEDAAKYNLRYNMWQLKKTLSSVSDAEDDIDSSSILITTKDMCYISSRWNIECDFTEIRNADISENSNMTLEKLRSLCDSITGTLLENFFFEGCESLDELILMNRYIIENKALRLLNMLTSQMYESGLYDECMPYLKCCQSLDPYSSENAKIMLEILIAQNKMQDAKKFYNNFCKLLAFDLEVEPEPEITALAEKIKTLQADSKNIEIVIDEHSSIEFSTLSRIIDRLLEREDFDINAYINDSFVMGDLASLNLSLARKSSGICTYPQKTRISDSFVEFAEAMIKDKIKLTFVFKARPDRVSGEIIEKLADAHKNSITIK